MQNAQAKNMALGQLITNEVTDKRILGALASVPREAFAPEHFAGAAYVDDDLMFANGRSLMAPLTFARLIQLAEITPDCRVLNVGALNGYYAAVLAKLAHHVTAIDTDETLITEARRHMERRAIANVDIQKVESMADGYTLSAPYDAIVMAGAVEAIPERLSAQLGVGGRLATIRSVRARDGLQSGLGKGLIVRRVDGKLQHREYFDASASMLPGFGHKQGFVF